MCNYLNNYDNLNGWSLYCLHLYEKCTKKMYSLFEWSIFKTEAIKKKVTIVSKPTLVQTSLYS